MTGATETSLTFLMQHLRIPDHIALHWNPHELAATAQPVKILWAHYLADQPLWDYTPWHLIDHVVCPSEYAREIWLRRFAASSPPVSVIRNGGADWFRPAQKRPRSMIYISTPFRGLEHVPEIWPRVRQAWPDATLHIFSGMALYGKSDRPWQDLYRRLAALPGVTYSGPIQHQALVPHLQAAEIFLYPNCWPESSCVSLIEAMRCGCIPILSDLGALPETAGERGIMVPWHGVTQGSRLVPDTSWLAEYADATIQALGRQHPHQDISDWACEHYDWKNIAEIWRHLLSRLHVPSVTWC